ncbi:MAG: dTDP-4-dehydrorhamnose reductase family protein [Pirellulaceae bacterium]
MRCLILGGDGMLGHQLLKSWMPQHEVKVTLRKELSEYRQHGIFSQDNAFAGIDVRNTDRLMEVMASYRPQAVVNAVGLVKQRPLSRENIPSLEINALFPHRLRLLCELIGARLIHISTDCVFNGRRGNYTEQDPPDAEDLYGASKYLGEVREPPGLTLRSSIIGLELNNKKSLIEWFLSQSGTVAGYAGVVYSGLTTLEMARVIEMVLLQHPDLSGLWHVASAPISKHQLLLKLAALLQRQDLRIERDDAMRCDRSLCGEAFELRTNYHAPTWDVMLQELAAEIQWKGSNHAAT